MDKRYHTVRMGKSPQVGAIFASSLLNPAPAPDKWWKVMFSPVQLAGVPGGFAVTLKECDPKPEKGPVGDKVHALLRTQLPEPTLGMIYAEVMALRNETLDLKEHIRQARAEINHLRGRVECSTFDILQVLP